MNEDYVSTKLARKLQQKRYPLKKVYRQDGAPFFYDLPQDHPDWSQCDAWYLPTIWEVLKWLREEKKMHIEIFLYNGSYSYFIKSITQICKDDLFHKCLNEDTVDEEYATCEQAVLAGIEYVIDNLI